MFAGIRMQCHTSLIIAAFLFHICLLGQRILHSAELNRVYDWRLEVVGLAARPFAHETAKAMPTDETEVSRCVFWKLHSVAIGIRFDSFTRLQHNLLYLYFDSPRFDVEHDRFHFH